MNMRFLISSSLAAGLITAIAGPAFAWHDHYHGGVGVGFYAEPYPEPYPYAAPYGYYAPPPVVVEPAPVYAAPPPPPLQFSDAQPAYHDEQGQYCREYQSTIKVAGVPKRTYGTACQQPDGQWKIIN